MKYCKKCKLVYTTDVCPSCNTPPQPEDAPIPEEEQQKRKRSDWITLAIGIPAFVGLMYLLAMLIFKFKG